MRFKGENSAEAKEFTYADMFKKVDINDIKPF